MRWHVVACAGLILATNGCGGAAPKAAAPAYEQPASPGGAAPEGPPMQEPPPSTAEPAEDEELPRGELRLADDISTLYDQFRSAESALLEAGHACDRACRALRSMQRATERMCELASDPEEEHRCDDATRRYREARDRVRVTCRVCPEGPVLDGAPDAG